MIWREGIRLKRRGDLIVDRGAIVVKAFYHDGECTGYDICYDIPYEYTGYRNKSLWPKALAEEIWEVDNEWIDKEIERRILK